MNDPAANVGPLDGQLRQRLLQQRGIAELGLRAIEGLAVDELLELAVDLVADTLDVEFTKVLENLPGESLLALRAGRGWHAGLVGHATVSAEQDSQAGYTLTSNRPVIVESLRLETRFDGPKLLHDHGVVSGVSVVIRSPHGPAFGVLGAHTAEKRSFSGDDVSFLQAVAHILSEAIDRAHTAHERDELLRELASKNEALERFAYTVSHDLRTPLVTIAGFVGRLEQAASNGGGDEAVAAGARIRNAISRMGELLNGLLELSRAGRTVGHATDVPLHEILSRAVGAVKAEFNGHAPEIVVGAGLPEITADAARLEQVVEHLLDNAIKFTRGRANPRIEMGGHRDGDSVVCYVRDNGAGIPQRYREAIFEPYFALEGAEAGLGLGLSLVRRIVDAHRGSVWVESDGPGQGSTFYFSMPSK